MKRNEMKPEDYTQCITIAWYLRMGKEIHSKGRLDFLFGCMKKYGRVELREIAEYLSLNGGSERTTAEIQNKMRNDILHMGKAKDKENYTFDDLLDDVYRRYLVNNK